MDGVNRSQKCPFGGFVGTWDSRKTRNKPKLPGITNEKLKYDGGAEILTVHSPPPQSASKKDVDTPFSPVSQAFNEEDVGISKHIKHVKKTEALEAS